MTTRNLVPRANNEGKIGVSSKKWAEVNATNGTFSTLKVSSLKLDAVADLALFTNGAGIESITTNADNQFVIAIDDTFLTGRLGFNADGTKPDFTLPNGDALPVNTVIAADDTIVSAIQKLNDDLRDVADPSNLSVASFAAAAKVEADQGETLADNKDSDTMFVTAKAIATYVDTQITAQGLDFQGDAGGALSVDLDSQVLTISGGTGLSSSGAGQTLTLNLDNTSVVAGSYGSTTAIPTFTVDAQGRLTAAGTAAISTSLVIQSDDAADNEIALGADKLKILGGTGITTSNVGDDLTITLDNTAVAAGDYGSATAIPTFTVDAQGRLTAAGTAAISTSLTIQSDDAADNTVALSTDKLKILGGTGITTSNAGDDLTITLDNTAVTGGQYGDADSVGQFTVDAQGRLTQAANIDISITSSQVNDATALNQVSKIVLRDGNGDFAAGTITADLIGDVTGDVTGNVSGNAGTATKWSAARTITLGGDLTGNVSIDGSADVTLTATVAADSVALGTDTTGDYVSSLVAGAGVALTNNSGEGATPTIAVDGVLEDLDTLGAPASDGQFIVATGEGTFAYESNGTVRSSLGLGSSNTPDFGNLILDNQGELRLREATANGTNHVAIKSPAALTNDYTLILPENDGNADEVLVTDGSGNLTWQTVEAAAGAAVNAFSIIAVAGQDNLAADVAQDTLNISQGSGISLTTNNDNGTDTLTIAVSNLDNDDIAAAAGIVDTKLDTISTANKVALAALDIDDGEIEIGAALADDDLIIVDDGASGTNRSSQMSRVATYIRSKDSSITTLSGLTSMGADGNMLTAEGNLTVSGNLVVNGDTTTVNTATLTVEDPLISLANGNNAADSVDIGFFGLYDSTGNQDLYAGLFRDASDSGKFKLFKDLQDVPTTTVDTAGTGYTGATLVASLEGDVTGNADTATALETTRSIGLGGDLGGSANFDGTSDITIAATIQGSSVESSMLNNNIVSGLDDIGAALEVTDEIIVSDNGTIKRTDLSRFSTMMAGTGLVDSGTGTINLNIDGLDELNSTAIDQTDYFVFSDAGTEKKISFSNVEDAIFANVSNAAGSDVTIAAGGATTIVAGAVDYAMINTAAIKDEDDMVSDSDSHLATQQSIKAYVDAQITAQDLDFQGDAGGALSIDLDSETLTIAGGTGISTTGADNTLTIDIDATVTTLTGAQTLTNKTLTSPVLNTGVSGTAILDEDDMVSDSDTQLATQQSIKAYVDAQITAQDLDFQGDAGGALSIDLDSETLTIAGGTGISTTGADNTLTIDIDATVTTLTGAQTLTNKTLTSPVLNTGISGTAILDEDDMSSNSDTQLATQQSIKAYVDAQITAQDLDFATDTGAGGSVDLDSQSLTIQGTADKVSVTHADQTITINVGSDIVQLDEIQTLTNKTLTSPTISGLALSDSSIVFEGSTSNDFETTVTVVDPTADRTVTIPDATTTLVGDDTAQTLTNKTLTSPVLNDGVSGTAIDTNLNSTADTDTTIPSAKAVKSYVDGKIGRFGGIFLTDSADNGKAAAYNRDVIFDSSPLVRSHFGPFAYDLQQLRDSAFGGDEGSDIIFYGATAFGASDRHFEVMPVTDADDETYGAGETIKGDCLFTGANSNTP